MSPEDEPNRSPGGKSAAVSAQREVKDPSSVDAKTTTNNGTTSTVEKTSTSYWGLMKKNRNFRIYLASFIGNLFGDWFTYLSSLSAIEQIQLAAGRDRTSQTAISALIVIRLAPKVLLSAAGGVLADGRDRRRVMMVLDLFGAAVAWMFVYAWYRRSIPLIYVATFCQEFLSGLYEPSRMAILPLIVPEHEEMKLATTISGLAWSSVAAIGSSAGGFLVALWGVRYCYVVDSITYLLSALLIWFMGGTWNVAPEGETYPSLMDRLHGMMIDGLRYVRSVFFGALVFLKGTTALVYGAADVLNVSFAEGRGNVEGRSMRLGLLFGAVGVGCVVGPLIVDLFTSMHRPVTIQVACLVSIAVAAAGSILLGVFPGFGMTCLFSAIRSMGTSAMWINSSLLLQKFTAPDMLGRVSSMDFSLALCSEALSAVVAGVLQDYASMSPDQVSIFLGCLGIVLLLAWTRYHRSGGGAVAYEKQRKEQQQQQQQNDDQLEDARTPTEHSRLLDHSD